MFTQEIFFSKSSHDRFLRKCFKLLALKKPSHLSNVNRCHFSFVKYLGKTEIQSFVVLANKFHKTIKLTLLLIIVARSIFLGNKGSFIPGMQVTMLALVGFCSLKPMYRLFWQKKQTNKEIKNEIGKFMPPRTLFRILANPGTGKFQ